MLVAALTGLLAAAAARSQPAVTEAEAHSYIRSAFITGAAPGILSDTVVVGPELRRRLTLAPDADRGKVYDALFALADGASPKLRKPTAAEVSKHRHLPAPLYAIELGEAVLLVQYDVQRKNISFVEHLAGEKSKPRATIVEPPRPPVVVEPPRPKPPLVAVEKPKAPVAALAKPQPAARLEALRPTGECVIKPVMSDQDLVNCGARSR